MTSTHDDQISEGDEHRDDPEVEPTQLAKFGEGFSGLPSMKAFAFLEAIAQAQRPLSVTEFSALLNVPQPTAHRIVHMLEVENLLAREPDSRRYGPGDRLAALSLGLLS